MWYDVDWLASRTVFGHATVHEGHLKPVSQAIHDSMFKLIKRKRITKIPPTNAGYYHVNIIPHSRRVLNGYADIFVLLDIQREYTTGITITLYIKRYICKLLILINSTKAFKTDLRDIDWSKGDYVEYKNAANILFREYGRYIRLTPARCDRSSVGVIDMQIRNTLNRENIMGFSHSGRMYNGANALFYSSIVNTLSCLICFSKNGITQKSVTM